MNYPLYHVKERTCTNQQPTDSFLTLEEAGKKYDQGWSKVEIGHLVMTDENTSRDMGFADRKLIRKSCEDYNRHRTI